MFTEEKRKENMRLIAELMEKNVPNIDTNEVILALTDMTWVVFDLAMKFNYDEAEYLAMKARVEDKVNSIHDLLHSKGGDLAEDVLVLVRLLQTAVLYGISQTQETPE